MKVKIKYALRAGELVAIQKHLATTLGGRDMRLIQAEPTDFLILSALYELYAKVKSMTENIRLFPSKRTDEEYNLTITRTQAIAFYCALPLDPPASNEMVTYEQTSIKRLVSIIHKNFLV